MIGNLSRQKIQICFILFLVISQSSLLAAPEKYKKVKTERRPDLMQSYKKMENPVSFADLPVFNGRTKFVCGYFQPEQNGVSACQMIFYAEEEPQIVLDFYKDTLTSNHWQIIHAAGMHIIASHPDGHMCTINVNESKLRKIKSKYTIAYRQLAKQH